jgi:hypothetical protein
MKESVGALFFSGILAFGGCTSQKGNWEYETVSGTSARVLQAPAASGWTPVGVCITSDGQKRFLLKRQKNIKAFSSDWQFKTVAGRDDKILSTPDNKGWEVVGFSETPDSNKWFLLKKPKT